MCYTFFVGEIHRMAQSVQFVKYKNWEKIQKHSSFFVMIEKTNWVSDPHYSITTKKIHFLDLDAVWWIVVEKRSSKTSLEFVFHLDVDECIRKQGIWSYFVTGSVNGKQLGYRRQPIFMKPYRPNSYSEHFELNDILKGKNHLILDLQMTMECAPNPTQIPIEKFINTTVHRKKIVSNNKCILNEPKYSDFTFIVQGSEFKVHKNILAASSIVFDKVFSAKLSETVTNECKIEDIDPVIFGYLLAFIYCGELPEKLHEENVARELFKAAHYYQIDELVETCTFVESYSLTVDNALDIYEWALTYDLEKLILDAWKMIKFDILGIYDEMKPQSLTSIALLLENKKKKEECTEKYRLSLSKLRTEAEKLSE